MVNIKSMYKILPFDFIFFYHDVYLNVIHRSLLIRNRRLNYGISNRNHLCDLSFAE